MRIVIAIALLIIPFTASAGKLLSVEDRVEIVKEQVKGNDSYQAHLARKLASFAEEEVYQHDPQTAQVFIKMAEEAAAKAGNAK